MNEYNIYNNLDPNIKKYMADMQNLTKLVIKKNLKQILLEISTDYNLNKDVLYKKYLSESSDNMPESDSDTFIENKFKCTAITKKNKQCTRNKFEHNDFCKNHLRLSKVQGGLPLGTIHKRIPIQKETTLHSITSSIDLNEVVLEPVFIKNRQLFYDNLNNEYYERDQNNKAIKIDISE